ncbi:MAG: hypothetical protein LC789_09560, partial [Actinobacteria bacterium]|nr:hypothetical protein [Actinomycetota bacterium]MCA1720657.1 hypothetical protein [Actinomycetota bacterium]
VVAAPPLAPAPVAVEAPFGVPHLVAAPAPAPAPAGAEPELFARATAVPRPASEVPLTVVESSYSTSDPVPVGVPAGGLPIGARAGAHVETSYVRLAGTGTLLRLAVSAEQGASFGPDAPQVAACRNTTGDWTGGRPGPAVPFDENGCAPGVRVADGYAFDLGRFADRGDLRGFALVAVPVRRTTTFRLTLTASPDPTRSTS